MGSIIAGMYAAGQLKEAKEWFLQVDKQLILRMMDINLLSGNSLVKGQRIIEELEKVVPDRPIEELNIPCSVVATDMGTSEEVIFRSGSLFQAVRASISIPLFFEPVRMDNRVLIDGGIVSPLPLHAVERQEGDLLAAMRWEGAAREPAQLDLFPELTKEEQAVVDAIRNHGEIHLNALADALHQPVYKLMSILVELDCKNVITTLPGCRYAVV